MRARQTLFLIALTILLRLPFLGQPIAGDDVYYLYGAQHAQIDPLHPLNTQYAFLGDLVDMRGHPHGPVNSWILGALMAVVGGVDEVVFHGAYVLFSLVAVLAMWSLARRFLRDRTKAFFNRPLIACLLFLAVPAFSISGNSLEADLPFLALWTSTMVLFIKAVDATSVKLLAAATILAMIATLTAYQTILFAPIGALYLLLHRRRWVPGWLVLVSPAVAIGGWQLWELQTTGVLPMTVLAGYMESYSLQRVEAKLGSIVALIAHLGWMLSPLIVLGVIVIGAAFPGRRDHPARMGTAVIVLSAMAAVLALATVFYDANGLFWGSIACGSILLSFTANELWKGARMYRQAASEHTSSGGGASADRVFLAAWIGIFFTGAAILFFAGAARYLLPLAPPLAILITTSVTAHTTTPAPIRSRTNAVMRRMLEVGIVTQFVFSLALAAANYQHWALTRDFARSAMQDARAAGAPDAAGVRVWANAELGMRHYLEDAGALPLLRDTRLRAGDIVIGSQLFQPVTVTDPTVETRRTDVSASVPLRLISLAGGSGFSTSAKGLLPFEIGRGPVDRLTVSVVSAREPTLSFIQPADLSQQAENAFSNHVVTGLYPDGWMSRQAIVTLKTPGADAGAEMLGASVYISPDAPARTLEILVDGATIARQSFPGSGVFEVYGEFRSNKPAVTLTLRVDAARTFPPDERELGLVVTGVGFR